MGRPSAYKPEYCSQAAFLCAKYGATDEELAEFFGVNKATITRWKSGHVEFCASLKEGKQSADARVERSLFERATGYSHPAVKIFNDEGAPLIVPYTEHYPPDTTACIFWLKNRQPARWRDKTEHGIEVVAGVPHETLDRLNVWFRKSTGLAARNGNGN